MPLIKEGPRTEEDGDDETDKDDSVKPCNLCGLLFIRVSKDKVGGVDVVGEGEPQGRNEGCPV